MNKFYTTINILLLLSVINGCANNPVINNPDEYNRLAPNFNKIPKTVNDIEICAKVGENTIDIEKIASFECSLYNKLAIFYQTTNGNGCYTTKPIKYSFWCMDDKSYKAYSYFLNNNNKNSDKLSEYEKRVIAKQETDSFAVVAKYLEYKNINTDEQQIQIMITEVTKYRLKRDLINEKYGKIPDFEVQTYIYTEGVKYFVKDNKTMGEEQAKKLYRNLISAYHVLAYPNEKYI